jgi:hypothetical protein
MGVGDVTHDLERLYREGFGALRNVLAPVVGNELCSC